MKKFLLMFSLFVSLVTFAQTNGEMKIATSTAVGQDFEFRVTRTNDASKVFVDWGDGNKQEATLEGWSSNKKVTGKLQRTQSLSMVTFRPLRCLKQRQHILLLRINLI